MPTPCADCGKRESVELSRLSPMKKKWPSGTVKTGVSSCWKVPRSRMSCDTPFGSVST
jgi:hypothetical protein